MCACTGIHQKVGAFHILSRKWGRSYTFAEKKGGPIIYLAALKSGGGGGGGGGGAGAFGTHIHTMIHVYRNAKAVYIFQQKISCICRFKLDILTSC